MKRLCQHFLAGAALTQQQHGRVARRDLLDGAADLLQLRVAGNEPGQRIRLLRLAQAPIFALQLRQAKRPVDDQAEHIRVEGLGQEVVGPEVDGAQGVGLVVLTGQQDDLGVGFEFEQLGEQLEAFLRRVRVWRQAQVHRHDCR